MGSVLCVWRCAGVRRARAVRVCVLDARARLRVLRARRRCVLCAVLCCALFVQLGGAALAGRAARWAAACCGWSCACLMVCGGRAARPTGSSAAQGASMPMRAACEAAARLARMFPCGEGRAYVFTLRARAGAGGGVVSPRSDVGWSSAWRGRARKRPCRHRRCREASKPCVQTESAIGDFKCAAYYAHVFCPDRYHRPSGRYAPRTTHLFYVSFAREALSGRYARCITHTSYAVGS